MVDRPERTDDFIFVIFHTIIVSRLKQVVKPSACLCDTDAPRLNDNSLVSPFSMARSADKEVLALVAGFRIRVLLV